MGVLEQFEGYTTPHCLEGVYDSKSSTYHKLIDLSGNNRMVRYIIVIEKMFIMKKILEKFVPWRKEGRFLLLPHEDNGFYENKWIYTETRKKSSKILQQSFKR